MVTRSLCLLFLLALSASAQTPRIPPPESVNRNGLVGRWLVPGLVNNGVALDGSRLDNTGTLSGSPVMIIRDQRPALRFTGTERVTIPTSPRFDLNIFTVLTWLHPTSGNVRGIACKADGSSSYMQLAWSLQWWHDYQRMRFWTTSHGIPTSLVDVYSRNDSAPSNIWSHVAAAYTGSELQIYINGVLTTNKPRSGVVYSTSEPVRIGTAAGLELPMVGGLHDLRLYNRALTANEIANIYRGVQ